MYSLLIVDDEDLELEALKSYVPWQSVGITEVMTASNGQEALEICFKSEIDIIITDIKMPILDGIELARELSKISYKAKIIFLSGYDDFAFVHDAYKAGGVEYILKPFSKEEVIKTVKEAQLQIESNQTFDKARRSYTENQLGKLVFNNDSGALNELIRCDDFKSSKEFYFFSIHSNAPHYLLKKAIQPLSRYCLLTYNKSNILVTVNDINRLTNIIERLKDYLLSESGIWCYFLYFKESTDLFHLNKKFMELEEYRQYLFYLDRECVIPASEFEKYDFCTTQIEVLQKILTFEFSYELDLMDNHITLYFEEAINKKLKPEIVIENVIDMALHIIKKFLYDETTLSKKEILDGVLSSQNVEDVKYILMELIQKAKLKFLARGGDKNDKLIAGVIRYIEDNFANLITTESLSEIVYLSPNYLRAIFKEKTGTTIHDYLTNYRMEKAIELLKSRKYKVKEISKMVGYDSESYFCAIFYKLFHTTPNEYKNKHWS